MCSLRSFLRTRAGRCATMMAVTVIVSLVFLALEPAELWGADAYTARIELLDGKTVTGKIDLPAFVVKTDYGFLTVPTGDILAAFPGFGTGKSTNERIDTLTGRLKSGTTRLAAATELRRIGRPAIPALQRAIAEPDENLANNARKILRDLWPCLKRVNPNGDAIVIARSFVVRGQMTFRTLRVTTDAGPRIIPHDRIRLIKFVQGDVPVVKNWPEYPAPENVRPDVEAHLTDGSRIRGQLDRSSLVLRTAYGVISVPVRAIVSIRPGATGGGAAGGGDDEIITRQLLLRGKVETSTFNIRSKMGPLKLARSQFDLLKVVPAEPQIADAEPEEPDEPATPTHEWVKLFNGKDLKGWRKWGPGKVDVVEKSILMDGECGLTYEKMTNIDDVIISAEIKLIKPGITKLALREGKKGLYHVEFTGNGGTIAHWDNVKKKNNVLKRFGFEPTRDQIYRMQFGAMGNTLLAYVNGVKVADVELTDDADVLGPGAVNVSIWQATSAFRSIEIKILTAPEKEKEEE